MAATGLLAKNGWSGETDEARGPLQTMGNAEGSASLF